MPKVFMSYAYADIEHARPLVEALHDAQIEVWTDQQIKFGQDFSSIMRSALTQSSAVIVLLTPRSLQSQGVLFEIGAAEALGKKIIPVLLNGDHLESQMPRILRNIQWIDARHKSRSEVTKLIRTAIALPGDVR